MGLSMKNKSPLFKLRAIFKPAGSGQWKTSCSLSYSFPQALEFPWLVPEPDTANWLQRPLWERREMVGSVSMSWEHEQGFTSDLYTCFALKDTR